MNELIRALMHYQRNQQGSELFRTYFIWVIKARLFVTGKPFPPGVIKHCSLLGPFVIYKDNEGLLIRFLMCLLVYNHVDFLDTTLGAL